MANAGGCWCSSLNPRCSVIERDRAEDVRNLITDSVKRRRNRLFRIRHDVVFPFASFVRTAIPGLISSVPRAATRRRPADRRTPRSAVQTPGRSSRRPTPSCRRGSGRRTCDRSCSRRCRSARTATAPADARAIGPDRTCPAPVVRHVFDDVELDGHRPRLDVDGVRDPRDRARECLPG